MIDFFGWVLIASTLITLALFIVRAVLGAYIVALEAMDAREERDLW